MASRISDHLRRNVYGLIAVFIALSGTAYAVDGPLAGQNQVGSEDIINGEVRENDLGSNAVKSGKVVNESLLAEDLAPNSVGPFELQSDSVGTPEVATDAIGWNEVSAATFNTEITDTGFADYGISDNAIQSSEVTDGSLTVDDLGTDSVGKSEVADNGVGSAEIVDGSVGGAEVIETSLAPTAGVYAASSGQNVQVANEGTVTVSSKQVPPGKYLVSASAKIINADTDQSFAGCALMKDGARIAGDFLFNGTPSHNGEPLDQIGEGASFSFEKPVSAATTSNLGILCGENGGGEIYVAWSTLTALEVDSIG
jgi:hypothetical protein